jgi:catechol 2,3-dioxygenase-like lactoylglutathione lyase family enzyme
MIHGLDHIVLAVPSLDAATAGYRLLLGRHADAASFQLANVRLDLRSHDATAGEGLSALAFAVDDIEKTRRLLQRRALSITQPDAADTSSVLQIGPAATHGVVMAVVARSHQGVAVSPLLAGAEEAGAVAGLDHVVIRSPNPERAVALYAGRLGLSLRLDRSEPEWGVRLLFFRCGDLIIELAHDLKGGIGDRPDRLWGLSWRVPDIAMAHARLRAARVDVSDLRVGRRPHTRVFTARSHTAGAPTLMIGPDPQTRTLAGDTSSEVSGSA